MSWTPTDGLRTGQHASELAALERPGVCDHDAFAVRVQFRAVDMNEIPADLDSQFDFCWSSCALEHLGSLEHGMRFIERAMALLRPGGIAVHTTEYNMTSNAETFEAPYTLYLSAPRFRRRDSATGDGRPLCGANRLGPRAWLCGWIRGPATLPHVPAPATQDSRLRVHLLRADRS